MNGSLKRAAPLAAALAVAACNVGGSSNIPVLTSKRSCRPIRPAVAVQRGRRSSMRSTFSRTTPATTEASVSGCRAGSATAETRAMIRRPPAGERQAASMRFNLERSYP